MRRLKHNPGGVAAALAALSDADLLRLKALARLRAKGLPAGTGWTDLLHEAIVRALDGSRTWPPGVPIVAFLAGVMRSLADEIWRRQRREAGLLGAVAADEIADARPDPERSYAAAQALAQLDLLFADDRAAMQVLAGLADGLSAEAIRLLYGLSETEYDTTRRRMRRRLLKAGIGWKDW